MRYYIQSKDEDFITIFIDMINHCNQKEFLKQQRSALITKSNTSLYLGGKVLLIKNGFNFDAIDLIQFHGTGIDLEFWRSCFLNIYKNLNEQ